MIFVIINDIWRIAIKISPYFKVFIDVHLKWHPGNLSNLA